MKDYIKANKKEHILTTLKDEIRVLMEVKVELIKQ